jgi:hypothetical protein
LTTTNYDICNIGGSWIFSIKSLFFKQKTSHNLKPGQTHRYRVRAIDNDGWVAIQNRSDSEWVSFKMAQPLK